MGSIIHVHLNRRYTPSTPNGPSRNPHHIRHGRLEVLDLHSGPLASAEDELRIWQSRLKHYGYNVYDKKMEPHKGYGYEKDIPRPPGPYYAGDMIGFTRNVDELYGKLKEAVGKTGKELKVVLDAMSHDLNNRAKKLIAEKNDDLRWNWQGKMTDRRDSTKRNPRMTTLFGNAWKRLIGKKETTYDETLPKRQPKWKTNLIR